MQFHPTAVVDPRRTDAAGRRRRSVEGFLITEAIRGEGAILLDAAGERFVDELAPRDEVARAIRTRLLETGAPAVGLDMRMVDPRRFPNVVNALRDAGIEPTRELVPVAPAAHYLMGGRRHRRRGARAAARPVRGRRVRVHRTARRQPARLQLALGVLRVRPPGRAGGARRAVGLARRRAARRRALETAATTLPTPETRAAVWELAGLERDREGLERLRDGRAPARAARGGQRARPRGEPRRPLAAGPSRPRSRARSPPLRARTRRRPGVRGVDVGRINGPAARQLASGPAY